MHAAGSAPTLTHPDAVCQTCHREIYDRYQKTSMAQGSGLAADGLDESQLTAKDLKHLPSGVTYHVSMVDGQAFLSYKREGTEARSGLDGRHRLDFFIGSGHRGRTYLYQVDGLWFEAPINWYGKKQLWDMAPAFEQTRVMPAPLPVDGNCLHCHAGDVQPAVGGVRNRFVAQPFATPGIGCAACHGDPTAHTKQMALKSKVSPAAKTDSVVDARILNPSKLQPPRREAICLQCHLEGDAAVYLPGRSLQSYKPGDDLTASVRYFVDASRVQFGGRASSQYEALLRSACRRATGDRLTCTTCHDPHSSPPPSERVAFFRNRCLTCHDARLMASHHPEQQDCAACHMPTRSTVDISHEQLTDHDIEARPSVSQPQQPLHKRSIPELVPVVTSSSASREFGLAYAQLAQRGNRNAGERALALLQDAEKNSKPDLEILNQLGFLFQIAGSDALAATRYKAALKENPDDITAAANLAVIEAGAGHTDRAIELLTHAVQLDPSQTAAGLNLAFLQCQAGQKQGALLTLDLMLRFNPDSTEAHLLRDRGIYGRGTCLLQ